MISVMSVIMLHTNARVSELSVRRGIQLAILMYDLKCNSQFKKNVGCNTRSMDTYIFETDIAHSGIYSRSPFYKGASMWNGLPSPIKQSNNKLQFKTAIKKHLGAH